ncbi:hypothetical protein XENOCAPTIV_022667, partial [Xenoophorus captivus]
EDQPVTSKAKWNGLFDWKKDKKFFARFEETVSPEREFAVEDSKYSFVSLI